jgi:hypothetical protein
VARLLECAATWGIGVKPDCRRDRRAFWFRRGLGLIHVSVWSKEDQTMLYLGFGHPFNPLLWYSDEVLLNSIQALFLAEGTEIVDLSSVELPIS